MKKYIVLLAILSLLACKKKVSTPPPGVVSPPGVNNPVQVDIQKASYTHLRASGNRVDLGRGRGAENFIDLALSGKPEWLVSISDIDFAYWVVVMDNGAVEAFQLRPDLVVLPIGMNIDKIPAGMPPTLALDFSGRPVIVQVTDPEISPLSAPIVSSDGDPIYVNTNGELVLSGSNEQKLAVDALPDARIVSNQAGELAVLSNPTADYQHGVLGDAIEARSITVVQTQSEFKVINRIDMPDQSVIEGVSPIWADIDEDGTDEILVTLSNTEEGAGAKLAVYEKDGTLVAAGPLSPGGWRHQLAVYKQQAGTPLFIVDCQKPHVQQIVNFYQLQEGELKIAASKPGYATHMLGSRNLDTAMAGDFDGDGVKELLVPSSNYQEIRSIEFENGELIENEIRVPGAAISTNFSATTLDGVLIMGVGTANNNLRIWVD